MRAKSQFQLVRKKEMLKAEMTKGQRLKDVQGKIQNIRAGNDRSCLSRNTFLAGKQRELSFASHMLAGKTTGTTFRVTHFGRENNGNYLSRNTFLVGKQRELSFESHILAVKQREGFK